MKQKIQTDFFQIKKIKNFYKIKSYCTKTITYNNLMKETNIGAIFIVKMDTIILHHLILYADHFNIGLYLIDGECKNIDRIFIVKKDDKEWKEVNKFIEEDIEFENFSLY
ncbi:hypothetical protein NAPIS_ORF02712 [Vairimorpha apis BRL 01]|uniref:Uncharacterized protein n=1 Tax=Vairimorpha apis BRL 01 TaxID=1037528 RepID=T0MF65_9MICR|nr:hypothetical protein NAPIS_ORF02712 [Vairimorpha apis BRL 01]